MSKIILPRNYRNRERGFIINPYVFGAAPATDPDYADTVALLHLDSMDGFRHTPTNSSQGTGIVYNVDGSGWTDITTANPKWGAKSLAMNHPTGASFGGINASHSGLLNLGSSDFTMECWCYWNAVITTHQNPCFFSKRVGGSIEWQFFYFNGNLSFYWSTDGTTFNAGSFDRAWTPSATTWYHLAFVRDGSNARIFVDGTQIGTSGSISGALAATLAGLNIGVDGANSIKFDGYMDDVRWTTTVARYTANFTRPSAAFPDS